MTYPIRTILTLALAVGGATLAALPRPVQTLELGRAAGLQFAASDAAALRSSAETAFWSHPGFGAGTALALLTAIWWRPLRRLLAAPLLLASLAAAADLLAQASPANAYYNKQDYAEPFLIYVQWSDSCQELFGMRARDATCGESVFGFEGRRHIG